MFKFKHYFSFVFALCLVLSIGVCAFAYVPETINGYEDTLLDNGEQYIISETGSVGTNNGSVKENNGSIVNNNKYVGTNKSIIENNNQDVYNNYGSIVNNSDEVQINNGTITCNASGGSVVINQNLIQANYGFVTENTAAGIIYNNIGGRVTDNYGTVYNMGGLVQYNHRAVYEYYPVTFSGDTDKLSIDEISEDQPVLLSDPDGKTWVKGNDGNVALILTPDEGYAVSISGSCEYATEKDGSIIVSNVRDALTVTLTLIPVANPYSVPATADNSNMPLWSALFIVFTAAAVLTRKKKFD